MAVHVADAEGGLAVLSVIASEDVLAVDVIAAAYQVAGDEEGRSAGSGFSGRSLFDLPLGETPSWTISEEAVETTDPEVGKRGIWTPLARVVGGDRVEPVVEPAVGFEQVANAMQGPLGLDTVEFDARQVSKARYTARGFYAASITSIAFGSARCRDFRRGVRRPARLRFGHSYAVVAVSQAPHGGISLWNQLPVFSAWITEPEDATDRHRGRRRRLTVAGTDYPICNRHSSESPASRSTATGAEGATTERGQAASQAQPLVTPTTRASPCPNILTSSCSDFRPEPL